MADGSIQVNEQTAYGGGHQRRCKCRCQRSCHDERAGVEATVGVQQRLMGVKQVAIRRGNPVAAVLASDHEAMNRHSPLRVHPSPRSPRACSVASPVQVGQSAEHLSRAFSPLLAERAEIRIPLVEAATHSHFKTVPLIADQIDRHADGQIAAHR